MMENILTPPKGLLFSFAVKGRVTVLGTCWSAFYRRRVLPVLEFLINEIRHLYSVYVASLTHHSIFEIHPCCVDSGYVPPHC